MSRQADDAVAEAESITVTVDNLGGIDHADISITPGVTVLRGRNATNRTSVLSAIDGALGGSGGSLKSDAQDGSAVLQIGQQRYTRTYRREGDTVQVGGDPYVSESAFVDSFVSLLEDNPARRAIERGEGLREIIMRPIDTDEIERRIESLQAEAEQLTERIEHVRERTEQLSDLRERRRSLESDLSSVDEEIEALRAEVDEHETDQSAAERADSSVEELDEARKEHNRVENEIEVTRAEIESLESQLSDLETGPTEEYDEAALDDVKEELAVARERRRQLDETVNTLFTIVEFNQDLLDGSFELPGVQPEDVDPVAQLAPDDDRELVCWTCGSRVTRTDIDGRLDTLRDVVEEKRGERADAEQRVTRLADRRETIESSLQEHERVREERSAVRNRLDEKRDRLSTLQSRKAELAERIAELETVVAETQQLRDDELLEIYERLSDCQYERGQIQQQLSDLRAEIEEIQSLPDLDEIREEREQVRDRIAQQRERIDRLESRTITAFNRHMDELLDVLNYENVARVWIENRTSESDPGASSTFELHVVREKSGGTAYEERLDNLSESERELIGLVFALAGYLSHEVYDHVPFMLLDSLEAIDSDRIAALVDHFSEYTDVLLVALLPEDARSVADRHNRIPASEI